MKYYQYGKLKSTQPTREGHAYFCDQCGKRKWCSIRGCNGNVCTPTCVPCIRGKRIEADKRIHQGLERPLQDFRR